MQASEGTSLIRKAVQQPDKVEKAWNMLKSDGLFKTIAKIMSVSTIDKNGQGSECLLKEGTHDH